MRPNVIGETAFGRTKCHSLQAPSQGRPRPPGLGRVRAAVERGHAWLNQFGRVGRRLDRSAGRFLGWVQLAACIIFIRAEANGFFR
jgi:transposase